MANRTGLEQEGANKGDVETTTQEGEAKVPMLVIVPAAIGTLASPSYAGLKLRWVLPRRRANG